MKILVFDTCFNKTYIVFKNGEKIIANERISSNNSNYHSVYLIPVLRDILKKNNILISDINAIGVNIGPGSFTGIRTAVTIARVFAQQADLKLIGVSSLQILSRLNNSASDCASILDARRNKVYFAKYSEKKEVIPPCLIDKSEIISKLDGIKAVICDSSIHSFLSENNIISVNYEENDENIGLNLCDLTEEILIKNQEDFNWAKIKPLYIQKPSITISKELKNV